MREAAVMITLPALEYRQHQQSLLGLAKEHKRWAQIFVSALILALQGDYSEINKIARTIPFEFTADGTPILKSEVSHAS